MACYFEPVPLHKVNRDLTAIIKYIYPGFCDKPFNFWHIKGFGEIMTWVHDNIEFSKFTLEMGETVSYVVECRQDKHLYIRFKDIEDATLFKLTFGHGIIQL